MRVGSLEQVLEVAYINEIWQLIGSQLNQTIQWVPESFWNDKNIAAFDAVRLDLVDISRSPWVINNVRSNIINFSLPIRTGQLALRVSSPSAIETATIRDRFLPQSLMSVFSLGFWTVLIALFIGFFVANLIPSSRDHPVLGGVWQWFAHCSTIDTMGAGPRRVISRFVMVLTGVFALHSLTLYQGALLTKLVKQPIYQPIVRDLEQAIDMISKKQAVLDLGYRDWAFAQVLDNAELGVWHKMKLATRDNPPIIRELGDPFDLDSYVDSGTKVISVDSHRGTWFAPSSTECNYVKVPIEVTFYEAMILSPNFDPDLIKDINRLIAKNAERIHMSIERYLERKDGEYEMCRLAMFRNESRVVGAPLRLWRLGEAFVLLAYGLALCLVVFVGESVMDLYRQFSLRQQNLSTARFFGQ